MRYLSLSEVLELHSRILQESGGAAGIRDLGALESAVMQPRAIYDGQDLYPDIITKAAVLCFLLVMNHPFIDGNKRIGHAAMETVLILNGYEINASFEEQEKVFLDLAAGKYKLEDFILWVKNNVTERSM